MKFRCSELVSKIKVEVLAGTRAQKTLSLRQPTLQVAHCLYCVHKHIQYNIYFAQKERPAPLASVLDIICKRQISKLFASATPCSLS